MTSLCVHVLYEQDSSVRVIWIRAYFYICNEPNCLHEEKDWTDEPYQPEGGCLSMLAGQSHQQTNEVTNRDILTDAQYDVTGTITSSEMKRVYYHLTIHLKGVQ